MDVIDSSRLSHWSDQPQQDDAAGLEMSLPSSSVRDIGEIQSDHISDDPESVARLSIGLSTLLRCARCAEMLIRPLTLPCGRTICQDCLPEATARPLVSYPDDKRRRNGFTCPIGSECGLEHCTADVNRDFVLQSIVEVAATWWTDDVSSSTLSAKPDKDPVNDVASSQRLRSTLVKELKCLICHTLFASPLTTSCGHTFCRSCLVQTTMGLPACPICRHALPPVLSISQQQTNRIISQILDLLVQSPALLLPLPDPTESSTLVTNIPTFVCTLSFPLMPTYLHIFELRYRRMLARVLQSSPPIFAMVGYDQSTAPSAKTSNPYGCRQIGTILEVVSVQMARDGRSVVETTGRWRFAIEQSRVHADGYLVSDLQRLDDVSVADEESAEIADRSRNDLSPAILSEKLPVATDTSVLTEESSDSEDDSVYFSTSASAAGDSDTTPSVHDYPAMTAPGAISLQLLSTLPTLAIFTHCTAFISEMQSRSASWLRRNVIASVGPMPIDDPSLFTWWFASVMPVSEDEKYRLLQLRSVRERLIVCAEWVGKARERMHLSALASGAFSGGYRMLGGGSGDMCAAM